MGRLVRRGGRGAGLGDRQAAPAVRAALGRDVRRVLCGLGAAVRRQGRNAQLALGTTRRACRRPPWAMDALADLRPHRLARRLRRPDGFASSRRRGRGESRVSSDAGRVAPRTARRLRRGCLRSAVGPAARLRPDSLLGRQRLPRWLGRRVGLGTSVAERGRERQRGPREGHGNARRERAALRLALAKVPLRAGRGHVAGVRSADAAAPAHVATSTPSCCKWPPASAALGRTPRPARFPRT